MNRPILLSFFIIFALIIANFVAWGQYLDVARYDPDRPDIPGTIINYFMDGDKLSGLWNDLIYGRGLQGSAIYIKGALALFLIPLIYALNRYVGPKKYQVFHTNWLMIAGMALFTFIGLTILGIAQTENWYGLLVKVTCPDGAIAEKWILGSFGFVCHWIIISIFAGWGHQLDVIKALRLPHRFGGRLGQMIKSIIIFLVLGVVEVYWQFVESTNPLDYSNPFGDSLGDVGISVAATFAVTMMMYWIVYDHVIYMSLRNAWKRFMLEIGG